jgi:hypothetical protein
MIDIVEGFEECAQDDIVKFNSGGSGSFDQGSNFCYTGYPQSMAFDWKFQNNETQIEYGGTVHNILQLDEEQMAIYTEESDGSSTIRHILVYRH